MSNTITISGNVTKQVNAISKLDRRIRTDAHEIAVRLACLKALPAEEFEQSGYQSVNALAQAEWGYSRDTVSKFTRVAERFITDSGRTSRFALTDKIDYSIGQLIEFLPLPEAPESDDFITSNITPDMTTKEIRKAVKEWLNPPAEDADTDESETVETTAADPVPPAYRELAVALDKASAAARMLDDVQFDEYIKSMMTELSYRIKLFEDDIS